MEIVYEVREKQGKLFSRHGVISLIKPLLVKKSIYATKINVTASKLLTMM